MPSRPGLYHELAIIVTAVAALALTHGGVNQTGVWTFMLLWVMRQSAKLNVFLGVRNLNEQFLPDNLAYLKSFMTTKPMNALFPFSVTAGTIGAALLVRGAVAATSDVQAIGLTFLATMLILAIVEHWFLVLPLPFAELWSWGVASRRAPAAAAAPVDSIDLESWTARLPAPCDQQGLHNVLDAAARGAFGELAHVKGIARAGAGWVHFDMSGGRASVSSFAPGDDEEPIVVAIGRTVDKAGLQAAFDACAAAA